MKILFLTSTRFVSAPWRDASTRYRCFNFAEDIRNAGHEAEVGFLDECDLTTVADYSAVCVLRPLPGKSLSALLARCRDAGVLAVADFDDLVFAPEYVEQSPAVVNGQITRPHQQERFEKHLQALRQFPVVTTATQRLQTHVKALHPDAETQTLQNGLSTHWLQANRHLNTANACLDTPTRIRRITYLPGSRSHNADFREVNAVLRQYLRHDRSARLCIVGDLDFDHSGIHASQLELLPKVDYLHLPSILAASFITIAPLCDTEFNACKSHIKFIESAAFGAPLLSSSNPDINRHRACDGLFVEENPDHWGHRIETLTDEDYWQHCSRHAIEYVHQYGVNRIGTQQLMDFIQQHIDIARNERTVTLPHAV